MDYYELLGVSKTVDQAEVKKAWKKLAQKHHPDRGGDPEHFKELSVAYDTLSDPTKRAQYDQQLAGAGRVPPFGFSGPNYHQDLDEDIIDHLHSMFGVNFGRQGQGGFNRARQPRRNKDLRIDISLSLLSSMSEQSKTISIQTTKGTRETVEIKIPRGVSTGNTIKYPNLGDTFFDTLPRGDLYVQFHISPDQKFAVSGTDLVTDLQVGCFDAIIGTQCEVTGIDGKTFSVTIPPGTQPNTKLRIRDQGLYSTDQAGRGNLIVEVIVSIPKNLSESDLQIVKQLTSPK